MFNPREHLMNLKGKDYLQVLWRLVWFREEKPLWAIDTKLEDLTESHAVFSAKVYDENGILKSAGYGSESIKDFRDYIEKAETKAVGRALAMLGYGTQFAPEMDECEDGKNRIVDSPVPKKEPKKNSPSPVIYNCVECGSVIEPYKGAKGATVSVQRHVEASNTQFGKVVCINCINEMKRKEAEQNA